MTRFALAVGVKGLINAQFIVREDGVYLLEVNPRASRTVPFLSKVTGVPMVELATRVALGATLAELGWTGGLRPPPAVVAAGHGEGFPTFYGYGLMGVGDKDTSEFTHERLLNVLRGDVAGPIPRTPTSPYVRTIAPGRATAPLVGGCLWLLLQTLGTPWELETDGTILFFEDTHAPPYYVDGQLTQLRHAGKLDQLQGVVVGEMNKCDYGDLPRDVSDWRATKSIEDVLDNHLQPLAYPSSTSCPSDMASTRLPFR